MKLKVEGGNLIVDIYELVGELGDESRRELADSVAINDDVIKFVTQQILDGWTECDSHGPVGTAVAEPYTGLEFAWREVAKRAGEVAAKEIARLEAALRLMTEHRDRLAEEIRSKQVRRDYAEFTN
jgi:hypothetical protein